MTDLGEKALLPAGFKDVVPPHAATEAAMVERLIGCFAGHGYARVKPPLLEFEETLLAGAGADVAPHTFRLMDPVSQRMMGLRADMTPQIARIAEFRLAKAARPLRLCYAGQVLRVRGTQLRPERQFGQVGVELIGAAQARADAEVVLLAAEALAAVGVERPAIDLNLPRLVGALATGLDMAKARVGELRRALDRKDESALGQIAGERADTFRALLRATGPAESALSALRAMALPEAAAEQIAQLARVVGLIRDTAPDLGLTVDPVENRGFEYQTGISFVFFAPGVRGELGRGGRYTSTPERDGAKKTESSTGFTLFMDSILRALPQTVAARRIYLPAGSPADQGRTLRTQGWVTVAALDEDEAVQAGARRLGCGYALVDGLIVEVSG